MLVISSVEPTRVNLTSRYHTSHSHSSLKRHALTSPTNAYSPPTVDVNVLFPAARSSTLQHASGSGLTLGGPHQTRSAQRCDVQSTVSSTGVHWNKNHTSSASSVSSLTVGLFPNLTITRVLIIRALLCRMMTNPFTSRQRKTLGLHTNTFRLDRARCLPPVTT